jgi:hypothetical protein
MVPAVPLAAVHLHGARGFGAKIPRPAGKWLNKPIPFFEPQKGASHQIWVAWVKQTEFRGHTT